MIDTTNPAVISFRPALREVGITNCPICKHKVKVNLTKTHRPFVNCSFCSVRIFYNGREAIRRLQKRMRPIKEV
jgi:DNA-directed RNA polymerase subunit RPC12/RpoP